MVFTILIGSQLLNLVVISFGGEHYIQQFLKSFDKRDHCVLDSDARAVCLGLCSGFS